MPIPKPREDEEQDDFISRCVSAIADEFDDNDQAVGVCFDAWQESKKQMNINDQLLTAIKARSEKKERWNGGILTADRYVKTLQECVGLDACYRFASTKSTSFDDVLQKASKTLTYNNPGMVVEEKVSDRFGDSLPDGIELPENTLMVVRHILTTDRKDRDGDILRTKGARPDPKMLALFQHVHTLPIGIALGIAEHTDKKLSVWTAIVDVNEVAKDAAVMIANGMGRWSHGFRAIKFEELKEQEGETTGGSGFDVTDFEIMERSLVSVASNTDAEHEVILSLVEGGKMTSPLMKDMGRSIRERRTSTQSAGGLPITVNVNVNTNKGGVNADAPGDGKTTEGKACGCGTPKEANGDTKKDQDTKDTEIKRIFSGAIEGSWEFIEMKLREQARDFLSDRGVVLSDRSWVNVLATFADHAILVVEEWGNDKSEETFYRSGWELSDGDPKFTGEFSEVDVQVSHEILEKMVKFHRTKKPLGVGLTDESLKALLSVVKGLKRLDKEEDMSDSGKKICEECILKVQDVIKSSDNDDERAITLTPKNAAAVFFATATEDERKQMITVLEAQCEVDADQRRTSEYLALVGTD